MSKESCCVCNSESKAYVVWGSDPRGQCGYLCHAHMMEVWDGVKGLPNCIYSIYPSNPDVKAYEPTVHTSLDEVTPESLLAGSEVLLVGGYGVASVKFGSLANHQQTMLPDTEPAVDDDNVFVFIHPTVGVICVTTDFQKLVNYVKEYLGFVKKHEHDLKNLWQDVSDEILKDEPQK